MAGTSEKRAGRRFLRRPVCLVALGLAMSLGAASALAAVMLPARQSADSTRSLTVRVEPSSRTVTAGASVRYTVNVSRPVRGPIRLSGLTRLRVRSGGLPAGASATFSPQRGLASPRANRRRTLLTVTTDAGTPAGTYTLHIGARRPHRDGSTAVNLVVASPSGSVAPTSPVPPDAVPPVRAPEAFTISGALGSPLTPGTGQPLDLTLTNLESTDLSISSLVVEVASVSSPESDPSHACGAADFSVQQFSGALGFTLPALTTVSLGALGFTASEWPQVSMLNLPVNQDGCKAASFSLAFAGTASEVTQ